MRPNPSFYLIIFLLPLSVLVGYGLGGWWTFFPPLFVFGLIPLLDVIVGIDRTNPGLSEEHEREQNVRYGLIPLLTTPIQVGMVIWGAAVITSGRLSGLEIAGLTVSIGISSGTMGINVAHELVHKFHDPLRRILGHLNLLTTWYMHWGDEHVKGHHRHVATPDDPTTARRGEGFWSFFPRTVLGTFRLAWELEAARLSRVGTPVDSLSNRMVWYSILPFGFALSLGAVFGYAAVLFFIVQSLIAILLLEATNYIEHYGLERKSLADGSYEKVGPAHSWNASNIITNYFLFNLQRHSDHHFKPRRPYQILRHFEQSPQLPTGYAGMIVIALIPPLWFAIMDKRLPRSPQ